MRYLIVLSLLAGCAGYELRRPAEPFKPVVLESKPITPATPPATTTTCRTVGSTVQCSTL